MRCGCLLPVYQTYRAAVGESEKVAILRTSICRFRCWRFLLYGGLYFVNINAYGVYGNRCGLSASEDGTRVGGRGRLYQWT